MSEPVGRLAVLVAVAAAVGISVWLVRWLDRRSSVRRLPADLGPFPAALYFGDAHCASCIPAADAIAAGELEVRKFEWASNGDVFDALAIAEVPRLIVAGRTGQVLFDIGGVPTPRQIARAKLQLSRE
jgi:hypothetical protein